MKCFGKMRYGDYTLPYHRSQRCYPAAQVAITKIIHTLMNQRMFGTVEVLPFVSQGLPWIRSDPN